MTEDTEMNIQEVSSSAEKTVNLPNVRNNLLE
jgi:hypothetical protein